MRIRKMWKQAVALIGVMDLVIVLSRKRLTLLVGHQA